MHLLQTSSNKCSKLEHSTGFVKATGDLSKPGGLQFTISLFSHYSKKIMSSVKIS